MTKQTRPIVRARHRHLLQMFSPLHTGLSIDEFRYPESSVLYFPPLIPVSVITETIQQSLHPLLSSQQFPIKRIKPIYRPFSRIESCLESK